MLNKIIIETNWWISFVLSKYSGNLPDFFYNETIDIYFSKELFDEIIQTLNYSRIKKRINQLNLKKAIYYIENFSVMVETKFVINICRDPKDNFLLALAKEAGADFLITRDEDLLVLKKFENTSIVTLPQFIKILKS